MSTSDSPSEPPAAATKDTVDASQLPTEALDLAAKLFDYARQGDTASLTQYLTAGIPPNLTNHEGNTLLMLAAYNGHPETVKLLLEKKADTNVLNGRGQSPIAGAVFKGYDDIVRLLVEAGADVRLGQPSAVDAAKMFRKEEALKIMGIKQ